MEKPAHVLIAEGLGWFDCKLESTPRFPLDDLWQWKGAAHWRAGRYVVPRFDTDWQAMEAELYEIKMWQEELDSNWLVYSRYAPEVMFVNTKRITVDSTTMTVLGVDVAATTDTTIVWRYK